MRRHDHDKGDVTSGGAVSAVVRSPPGGGALIGVLERPERAAAWRALGAAALGGGDRHTAGRCFAAAVRIAPNDALAWQGMALVTLGGGDRPAAAMAARRTVALEPGGATGWGALAEVARRSEDLADAARWAGAAIRLVPDNANQQLRLGEILLGLDRSHAAAASFLSAIGLDPTLAAGHVGAGIALRRAGRLSEAVAAQRRALVLMPGLAHAWGNLANAENERAAHHRALTASARARQLAPLDPEIAWAHAHNLLRAGPSADGWRVYEDRLGRSFYRRFADVLDGPRWDGRPLGRRTLLLQAEQGLGDTLQFVRFAARIPRNGGRVVLRVQPELVRLLAGADGIDAVLPLDRPPPAFDVQAALLSLPSLLKVGADVGPRALPYIPAPPRLPLAPEQRPAIGLVWRGSAGNTVDRVRSCAYEDLAPLLARDRFSFVALQLGDGRAELPGGTRVIDAAPRIGDVLDTAAIMMALDHVVTVDTSMAHLAGALGRPVSVLLPAGADWRWGVEAATTPWYPTARLYRQVTPGDWSAPIAAVADALDRSL
jgi:tetratricopeptide (TPR) repeat protein